MSKVSEFPTEAGEQGRERFSRWSAAAIYRWKAALIAVATGCLLAVVMVVFWYQDLRYALPTPQPQHFIPVSTGTTVDFVRLFPELGARLAKDERLIFFHFFNPDCPCSRFNADHINALYRRYRDSVRFIAVVQTDDVETTEASSHLSAVSRGLGGMETVVDYEGKAAAACGVYSTPQAVILRPSGEILFRGNYNASRYCLTKETEFAREALDALLNGLPLPNFPPVTTTAYGCELPTTSREEHD